MNIGKKMGESKLDEQLRKNQIRHDCIMKIYNLSQNNKNVPSVKINTIIEEMLHDLENIRYEK